MSVLLEPAKELAFPRPVASPDVKVGTAIDKEILKIKNPTASPVAFKVKTTAPRSYCVRPNAGRIEPSQTIDVQVLVQAVKEAPPPGAKCKDKFLVQSVHIGPDQERLSVAEFWLHVERESKASIIEQKIRCNWKSPQFETVGEEEPQYNENNRTNSNGSNGSNNTNQTPIITATPYQQASDLPNDDKLPNATNLPPVPEQTKGLGIRNDNDLSEAQSRIAVLENQLHQLKSNNHSSQQEGVPLQIVAGIAISVFIITYLFL